MISTIHRQWYRSSLARLWVLLLSLAMFWVSGATMAGASLATACSISKQQCTISVQKTGAGQVKQIALPDQAPDGEYEEEGRAIQLVAPMDELEANNGPRRAPSVYFAKRILLESDSTPLPHRPDELLRPPIA